MLKRAVTLMLAASLSFLPFSKAFPQDKKVEVSVDSEPFRFEDKLYVMLRVPERYRTVNGHLIERETMMIDDKTVKASLKLGIAAPLIWELYVRGHAGVAFDLNQSTKERRNFSDRAEEGNDYYFISSSNRLHPLFGLELEFRPTERRNERLRIAYGLEAVLDEGFAAYTPKGSRDIGGLSTLSQYLRARVMLSEHFYVGFRFGTVEILTTKLPFYQADRNYTAGFTTGFEF